MAVDTYAKLQSHLADTINRDDLSDAVTNFSPASLDSTIVRMIAQAEERVERDIIARGGIKHMETVDNSLTTSSGVETVTLPSDFKLVRTFTLTSNPNVVLQAYPDINSLFTDFPATTNDEPAAYSIVGTNTAYLRPIPDGTYSTRLIYYAALPRLSDSNTSNWLLTNGLGVYVAGTMTELCMYLESNRLEYWEGYYKQKLNDMMNDDRMVRFNATPTKPSLQVAIA